MVVVRTKQKTKDTWTFPITYLPVALLMPYAKNARTHTPEQVANIAKAMRRFGYTNPVLADREGIVAGHGRCLAAAALYAEGEKLARPNGEPIPAGCVPVVDVSGWSADERRAYILADNRLGELGEMDEDVLRTEVEALNRTPDVLADAGFSAERVAAVMDDGWSADPEAIERAGSNTDGIRVVIKLLCPPEEVERVKGRLTRALGKLALETEPTVD
jgi:ParB-like chromosome segregation protein Spo0J